MTELQRLQKEIDDCPNKDGTCYTRDCAKDCERLEEYREKLHECTISDKPIEQW